MNIDSLTPGTHSGHVKTFLQGNLQNPIIIEAGTAAGTDTKIFCEMFPQGYIYGFEPVPELFNQAVKNTSMYKNVLIQNKALSFQEAEQDLYLADMNNNACESSSLLPPKKHLEKHPNITFKSKITVKTISLDSFVQEHNIQRVDLLWLDLQGIEPLVLKNSLNTLSRTKCLFTEISLIEIYDNNVLWPEYHEFLQSQGFERLWDDLCLYGDSGNALLINKRLP